jgi:hypothetical protein
MTTKGESIRQTKNRYCGTEIEVEVTSIREGNLK